MPNMKKYIESQQTGGGLAETEYSYRRLYRNITTNGFKNLTEAVDDGIDYAPEINYYSYKYNGSQWPKNPAEFSFVDDTWKL